MAAASRGVGERTMAISETSNPMTKKVSGKFDRRKVMAEEMKSAMTVEAYRRAARIDNLPPLRAQLSGVMAESGAVW